MTRVFTVEVTGCKDCPNKHESDLVGYWCGAYPRNQIEPESITTDNFQNITESCPMFTKSFVKDEKK
jgi:hypothetical protein